MAGMNRTIIWFAAPHGTASCAYSPSGRPSLSNELQRRHDTLSDGDGRTWADGHGRRHDGRDAEGRGEADDSGQRRRPIGQIVVDANANGEVRGYVDNPQVQLPSNALGKLDVAGAVGRNGLHPYHKDLGLKEPYRGSMPIVSGELAEDFTYYFAKSEQTPSVVGLKRAC